MDLQNNWQPAHVIMAEYGWLGMSPEELRIVLNGQGLLYDFEITRPWSDYNLNFFPDLLKSLAEIDYTCDLWTHRTHDHDNHIQTLFFFKRSEDAVVVRSLLDFG